MKKKKKGNTSMVSRLRLACPSRLSPTAHQAGAAEYAQIQTPRLRQLHNGLKAHTQKPFFLFVLTKLETILCCLLGSGTNDLQIYEPACEISS